MTQPLFTHSTQHPRYAACQAALREIYDPEVPVNIYDMGLIYGLTVEDAHAHVAMTLTSPACPVAGEMPAWVQHALERVDGIETVKVDLVWEPPWGLEHMTDEAKLELGML